MKEGRGVVEVSICAVDRGEAMGVCGEWEVELKGARRCYQELRGNLFGRGGWQSFERMWRLHCIDPNVRLGYRVGRGQQHKQG